MADQTIDAIKVRLGVDTGSIAAGVNAANEQLDKIGSKTRVVRVRVEAVRANTGAQSLHGYMQQARKTAKEGIAVPVRVKAEEAGTFGVGKLRTKIAEQLAQGGGVNVPIKVKLNAADAAKIRRDISQQIGTVQIYFDWVARNKPEPPPGGAVAGAGPTGGGGGGGAPAGGTGTTGGPTRGRMPGETRKQAQDRHRAENAARQAQARADREAQKNADTARAEALKELEELKRQRNELVSQAGLGGGSTPSGKPERSERQKQLDAEVAAQRKIAKEADERAAKTESAKVRERAQHKADTARARIAELDKERRTEAARLRAERQPQTPVTPTPAAEPTMGGTGSRPAASRGQRAATGAPATGEARGPVSSQEGRPGFIRGVHGGGAPIEARHTRNFRTSTAPRDLMPWGAEWDPVMKRLIGEVEQGETPATVNPAMRARIEATKQTRLQTAMSEYVARMQAAGVDPADPDASREYLRRMKGSSRRRMFQRLGPPGVEGDPLEDPDTLAAFLGTLKAGGEWYSAAAIQSKGQTATRLAGARKGGRAGGGGEYAGSKGTRGVAEPTRPEDIEVPTWDQSYINEAMTQVAAMQPNTEGYIEIDGKLFKNSRKGRSGAAEMLGRAKFADEEAKALAKRQAAQQKIIGVRGPETEDQQKARAQREAYEASEAAALNARRAEIRDRLIKEGVPATVLAERIEGELRGRPRSASTATPAAPKIDPYKLQMIPGSGPMFAASYPAALAQSMVARLGRMRRASGLPRLSASEEMRAFNKAKLSAEMREDEGLPRLTARAEGGNLKWSGALWRSGSQAVRVGERGEELLVRSPDGNIDVVPKHQIPSWRRRALDPEGEGATMLRGKDFTGRAEGGFTFRGKTGFVSASKSGTIVDARGMIQRVFVVNWPSALQAAAGVPAQGAAGANIGAIIGAIQQGFAKAGAGAGAGSPAGSPAGGAAGGGGGKGKGKAPGGAAGGGGGGGGQQQYGPGVGRGLRGQRLAQGRFFARQLELSDIQSQISEAQSLTPVRALSVSVGQITSQLSGRAEIQQRARRAARLTSQAESSLRAEQSERSKLAEMLVLERRYRRNVGQLSKKEAEALSKLPDEIDQQRKRVERANKTAVGRQAAAREAAGNIITPGAAVKNVVAGAVGISIGTAAFSVGYGLLNTALSVTAEAFSKAADRAMGYVGAASEMNASLAESTKQANGNAKAATAMATAQSGLAASTAAEVQPLLQQRAATLAGNANLQTQDVLRGDARRIGGDAQRAGLPAGFDSNLVRTTGGFLGIGLGPGSQMPTAEIIQNRLGGARAADTSEGTKNVLTYDPDVLFGFGNLPQSDALADLEASVPRTTEALKDLSAQAQKGGSKLSLSLNVTADEVAKTAEAFRNIGADQLAGEIERSKVGLKGGQVNEFSAAQFLDSIAKGSLRPTPQQLIQSMSEQLRIQIKSIAKEGAYERNAVLPAQTALRYIATPQVPFMDERKFPNKGVGSIPLGGAGEDYRKAFAAYAGDALPAQKEITAEIQKGKNALLSMGVPPQLLSDIGAIGEKIQSIQLDISQRSLNLTVADYNNQLRIANRSLRDAQDFMAGIRGEAGGTLGALEGQNAAMSRQLQLLQFELTQRQINYRIALAGFTAPGQTPEERAARIQQAKIEAEYAQKQLELQKKIGANQYQVVQISAGRSITDLQAQIELLTQGRTLAIDTAAAQDAIKALQEQQEVMIGKAQSYAAQGQKIAQLYMNTWTDIQTQAGELMVGLEKDLVDAFEAAGAAFVGAIRTATDPGALTGEGSDTPNASNDDRHNATGYLGYHATPMSMTVGDAGGEEVAVLRNPRRMLLQQGGGGGQFNLGGITVIVNGGGGGEGSTLSDAERMAELLARKVEERLSRKLSLIGTRTTF